MRATIAILAAALSFATLMPSAPGQIQTTSRPSPAKEPLPAYPAAVAAGSLATVSPRRIETTPLAMTPYVFRLDHLAADEISSQDRQLIRDRQSQLKTQAAIFNFNLEASGWKYDQILCPAFPQYLFLAFEHGPDPSGSSRFVAVVSRQSPEVQIVTRYAHGAQRFGPSSNQPGTYAIFNRILLNTRDSKPLGKAPNWLVIAMCYAEMSGYPVQVMTTRALPDSTLDMLRLGAVQPQLQVLTDQSAIITFSDIAHPDVTANWTLQFDSRGQLTSADHSTHRQPANIALEPKPR